MASVLQYKAKEDLGFLKSMAFRVCIIGICISAGLEFKENPVGISILFGIALLFFLFIGDEELHVYNDKIVIVDNTLLFILLNKRSNTYNLQEVKRAYFEDEKPDLTGKIFMALLSVFSKSRYENEFPINLEMRNGETKVINTKLDHYEKNKIINLVNKQVQKMHVV